MLTNVTESTWEESTWHELVFDDGHNNGFGFPCDENGTVPDDLNDAAKDNLAWCRLNPKKFVRFSKVVKHKQRYRKPAQGRCKCGEIVILQNEYMGACQCQKCGQWYNLFGQELLDPDKWGWDGTPMEED